MSLTKEDVLLNYYNLVMIYLGKSYDSRDVDLSLEQDFQGNVVISRWSLEGTPPTFEDLISIPRERLDLFIEKSRLCNNNCHCIGGFFSTEYLERLGIDGMGKGILIYNTDLSKLQVFNGEGWVTM